MGSHELMAFIIRRRGDGLEYSFKRGSLDVLLRIIREKCTGIVDFDIIYPEDFARLGEYPAIGITLLEMPVVFLSCKHENENDVLPAMTLNEDSRVFDYVVARSQYRFRPTNIPPSGLVTVFELFRNVTRAQAKAAAIETGRVREGMNYFSDEFDFAGVTAYDGVRSIVGFDALELDGISILDSSPIDKLLLKTLSKTDMEEVCATVFQVDERRKSFAKRANRS